MTDSVSLDIIQQAMRDTQFDQLAAEVIQAHYYYGILSLNLAHTLQKSGHKIRVNSKPLRNLVIALNARIHAQRQASTRHKRDFEHKKPRIQPGFQSYDA